MSGQLNERFSEACGFTSPLELLVSRPGEVGRERVCLLEEPSLIVGRDRRAHLRLEGPAIGQRHAYFQVIAGQLFCVDLDSRTGLHWEDGAQPAGWLEPGRVVRVGPYEVRLVRIGNATVRPVPNSIPTEARLSEPPAHPQATVEFSQRGKSRARCRLTRILTLVGRSRACRLRLSSPEVSRYHCALLHTERGFWVIDLQGRGGIRVNGTLTTCANLGDGDRLEVGPFEICLKGISVAQPASASVPTHLPLPVTQAAQLPALDGGTLGPVLHQLATMQQHMFDQFQQAVTTMVQTFGALHREQMELVREELDRLRDLSRELHTLRTQLAGRPSAPAVRTGNGTRAAGERPPATTAPAPVAAEGGPTPSGEGTANGTAATAPTAEGDPNIHAWLTQRIAALDEERQSRWQKLLKTLLGK